MQPSIDPKLEFDPFRGEPSSRFIHGFSTQSLRFPVQTRADRLTEGSSTVRFGDEVDALAEEKVAFNELQAVAAGIENAQMAAESLQPQGQFAAGHASRHHHIGEE